MMYGWNGTGSIWMIVMPLLWIGLIALIIWAVVRLTQDRVDQDTTRRRETPQEILDRRYALGEIDTDAYLEARARLAGREREPR